MEEYVNCILELIGVTILLLEGLLLLVHFYIGSYHCKKSFSEFINKLDF